jgi:hypothetical protein
MPRQVLEFRVIVASPSELYETRKAVFEVIHELNRTLEAQGVAIRGLGWEEYATPGIGSEVQEVINTQLLREYDILIALFATRLGTPTERHISGTVEEIEHAISNTSSAMGSYRVQIYFKDRIESASSISIDEFARLSEFREQLGPRGILYKLFKDDDQLRQEIRVNIQRPILEYLGKTPRGTASPKMSSPEQILDAETLPQQDDGIGLLDLQEEGEEALSVGTTALNRISEVINEINEATNHQTSEIEKLSFASTKDKKNSINEYAAFIEERANALKKEASIARQKFAIFSQTVISLAGLQKQSGETEQYRKDVAELLKSSESMFLTLSTSRANVERFKTAIQNLPKITSQFNRSKRLLIEAIDECIDLIDRTQHGMYQIADGLSS